ncbi:uncharacterized protein LOC110399553 isoform X2 [Numida meleagris]|uniref:uncharacterized protein LOC110399553 isoform X2 n=1 Tax=Numida meleagris TaxID=8996 RepID=UPI000B3E1E9A|nr:uncharacterized protein LOC110399553 isoform X2 [Numida meleagris]
MSHVHTQREVTLQVRGEEVSSVPRCQRRRYGDAGGSNAAVPLSPLGPSRQRARRGGGQKSQPSVIAVSSTTPNDLGNDQRPHLPHVQPFLGTALHPKRLHLHGSMFRLLTQPSASPVEGFAMAVLGTGGAAPQVLGSVLGPSLHERYQGPGTCPEKGSGAVKGLENASYGKRLREWHCSVWGRGGSRETLLLSATPRREVVARWSASSPSLHAHWDSTSSTREGTAAMGCLSVQPEISNQQTVISVIMVFSMTAKDVRNRWRPNLPQMWPFLRTALHPKHPHLHNFCVVVPHAASSFVLF